MKSKKLNLTSIVPANDVLLDELADVKGGSSDGLSLCFKGCTSGDSGGNDNLSDGSNMGGKKKPNP